jgi:hypothetical protein
MTQTNLAASADYADALLTARRAKTVITVLLLLVLISELALFFVLRYFKPLPTGITITKPEQLTRDISQYGVGLLDIAGLILPALLAGVIYLILKVQLVARLIGVGRITAALVWAILLMLLLFPWQAVLNNPAISYNESANAIGMKLPGVIYTWAEVSDPWLGARFGMDENEPGATHLSQPASETLAKSDMQMRSERAGDNPPKFAELILHWARYVAFPVLSILILTIIHFKTQRALRQSLGEDVVVAETTPAV